MGLQIRRDSAADWTSENPTLAAGEEGYETDTGKRKVGDGSTAWNSLAYDNATLFDAELAALAGLTSAANKLPYFTGSGTAALADLSVFARTILDDADEAAFKATVNLEIGTDVQAFDADLSAIAALSPSNDDIVQRKAGAWTNRTMAQLYTDLQSLIKPIQSWDFALSDESTALTTGTAKLTWRTPYAITVTEVRASVNTAPTGSTIIVDINEGGSTILSTKLSIDASEFTSTTAASAAVISDTALADDAEITFDIDQIGSTIAGKGLKVSIIGRRT
jgi:hypothetical protein